MNLRNKVLAALGLILSVVGWLHFRHPVPSTAIPLVLNKEQIKEVNHILATSPNYGHGLIFKNVDGKTTLVPKSVGVPFDIGLSLAQGPSSQLYLTTEVFYYRHFELLAGVGATIPVVHPRVMGALGYRLPWKRVNNLSLFVGYTTAQEIVAGVYFRFGSN